MYAASILPHSRYLSKTWYQSAWDRPKTPNGNRFEDALFNAINYYGLCDTTLKTQFDNYLVEREKLEKEKEAKRQARAARRATMPARTTTSAAAATNPGKITKYDWAAFSYFPEEMFSKVVNDGCNVNIDRIVSKEGDRRVAGSGFNRAHRIAKITVSDKDTGEVLYDKEITVTAPNSGDFTDIKVYSSEDFKNLPERQFGAWLKRKVDQVREEKAAAPQDGARIEITDSDTEEVEDEN